MISFLEKRKFFRNSINIGECSFRSFDESMMAKDIGKINRLFKQSNFFKKQKRENR